MGTNAVSPLVISIRFKKVQNSGCTIFDRSAGYFLVTLKLPEKIFNKLLMKNRNFDWENFYSPFSAPEISQSKMQI